MVEDYDAEAEPEEADQPLLLTLNDESAPSLESNENGNGSSTTSAKAGLGLDDGDEDGDDGGFSETESQNSDESSDGRVIGQDQNVANGAAANDDESSGSEYEDLSDDESEEEGDPDLEFEEDLGVYRPRDDDDDDDEDGDMDLNYRAMIEELKGDEKHRAKWERYELEKAALIKMGTSVKCKPPRNQGIDVGSQVQQRRAPRRIGFVVADNRDEEHDYVCWEVQYEDEAVKFVKSTELILIKDERVFEWVYTDDVYPINPVLPFRQSGVLDFDFSAFKKEKLDTKTKSYDFPFLRLLQHLWPGDWRKQLESLNAYLGEHKEKVRLLTCKEWWVFWGIIFAACPCQKGGAKLFEQSDLDFMFSTINFGTEGLGFMSKSRFFTISANVCYAFYDNEQTDDPWHPILGLLNGYNENRKRTVASSSKIVLDESMSPFKPRTTKTSSLPHLQFILRKPKPLGVEYKNAICPKTKMILFQEVQRGKEPMRKAELSQLIGTNAACAIRLILGSVYCGAGSHGERSAALDQGRRYLATGDSWFGSAKTAECVKLLWPDGNGKYKIDRSRGENPNGHEFIGSVKANSGRFPKKELRSRMKHYPSGSHLVMQCCTPETNIQLVAVGYKFNSKTTLCFVMTRNAGQTSPGPKPYVARFNDTYGNVKERRIKRPAVLSEYFADSDAIDSHNHCHQHRLGLEKYWLTQNPWFRNNCTLIGMTAIDAFRAITHHVKELRENKEFKVAAFAKGLAEMNLVSNKSCSVTDYLSANAFDRLQMSHKLGEDGTVQFEGDALLMTPIKRAIDSNPASDMITMLTSNPFLCF
ncbi:hypothetical protein FisN_UnNu081 [Fistulifera solaris]|uniref:PiggyBac transposable element-derived protein domain-containing protein n=1 Tax=Fistulifera solaris TaxID=1519565 RepID=A0A1Z5JS65_FISSO|nr:hypothetical protein FisN_UnNu081 [Fistulifera solaris]|eukprot:GAX16789.1 hypothetical protein FisN_UnNu081 [Fistulifera solaris]